MDKKGSKLHSLNGFCSLRRTGDDRDKGGRSNPYNQQIADSQPAKDGSQYLAFTNI